jgi:8-oxo-dGTP pyrophosphatase MutT (NUDIX family)
MKQELLTSFITIMTSKNCMKIQKVYAYITYEDQLLLFRHTRYPEAGIQVPGGTVEEGETPEEAVLREAREETGLNELSIRTYLGATEFDLSAVGSIGIHQRHFFHLLFNGIFQERWRHFEKTPSNGHPEPIEFEFYWVKVPEDVPELIAEQGKFLSKLELKAQ